MPSSVSTAAWLVTTQPGRGSGPRQSGSTVSQVEKRWSWSGSSLTAKSKTNRGSRSRKGSGTKAVLSEVSRGCNGCCEDIGVGAPGVRGSAGGGHAKDSRRHVTPPLGTDGSNTVTARPGCGTGPSAHNRFSGAG